MLVDVELREAASELHRLGLVRWQPGVGAGGSVASSASPSAAGADDHGTVELFDDATIGKALQRHWASLLG